MEVPSFAGPWSNIKPPLQGWIQDYINRVGFTQMTPVQASTIPLFRANKDVVVEAITGSGKTLSFLLPILEKLSSNAVKPQKGDVFALIISPTRELAIQTHSQLKSIIEFCPDDLPQPLLLVSDQQSSSTDDRRRFDETGAQILIGTPGRVEEFIGGSKGTKGKGKGTGRYSNFEMLVLDEADRLLDLGFLPSLKSIISHLPKQRRTGLFSATMTDQVGNLVAIGLRNPVKVIVKVTSKSSKSTLEERRTPATLRNTYTIVRQSEKFSKLLKLLKNEIESGKQKLIVYFPTCALVDYIWHIMKRLPKNLLPPSTTSIHSLHGHIPPPKRTSALESFSNSPSAILLCTDVAARGIDLPDVDTVIQFEAPTDPRSFSHRVGRTARAGNSGKAILLLSEGPEEGYVEFLNGRKIPLMAHPQIDNEIDVNELLEIIRSILIKDRSLHDSSIKALTSTVRSYSKHEQIYLFRSSELDIIGLAKAFGLLRMPKMPELKGKNIEEDEWKDAEVDWDSFAYANPAQETARKRKQVELSQKPKPQKVQKQEAWSNQKDRHNKRITQKEKKEARRKFEKAERAKIREEEEGDSSEEERDWKELVQESKQNKRRRKEEKEKDDEEEMDETHANFDDL